MKTVVGTYDNIQAAYAVANDLISAGYNRDDISIIANDHDGAYSPHINTKVVKTSDGIGAAVGGIGSLLGGIGDLAIPGIGLVIAAGPALGILTEAGAGAVAGGIIGALVDLDIPDEEANIYAEGLRHGDILVITQAPDAGAVTHIMDRAGLVDIHKQADTWRASGWETFDPNVDIAGASRRI